MSTHDELITQALQLLRRAGLTHAESIRPLSRTALAEQLANAGRELGIYPGAPLEELVDKVQTAAQSLWAGELTYNELYNLWRTPPSAGSSAVGTRGLPGHDDFPVWGRDRDLDEASALPGEDDFKPWGSGRGEDEPER